MPHLYAPSAVRLTSSLMPLKDFNDKERLAASQDLIRTGLHKEFDIQHLSTWRPDGLHPSFFPVHPQVASVEEKFKSLSFLESSVGDVFDAVSKSLSINQMLSVGYSIQLTMQDWIDGGITLLLRTPGYKVNKDTNIKNIGVDVYFTLHKLSEADPSHNISKLCFFVKFREVA